jgi:hypothetical protein
MKRLALAVGLTGALTALLLIGIGSAGAQGSDPGDPVPKFQPGQAPPTASLSGVYDFKDSDFGTAITECPQARLKGIFDQPLDRRTKDAVEVYSDKGNDRRTNEEFSCFPQNETSIDLNPTKGNKKNVVAGINDYRLGTGSSGFAASTDDGKSWYSGIIPFPSVNPVGTTQGFVVSGGDPAVVFDRAGVVYYAQIAFNRDDDTNGVTVQRSTNGGFTWSRACIVHGATPPAACGSPGDPRQPGDGAVSFQHDNDTLPNGSIAFDDKEYIAAGPRPAGVSPQCYTSTHAPTACPEGTPISPDRLYVTWTKFTATGSRITESHSDDQGRSWSPQQTINGSASFCVGGPGTECNFNQFSTPTVSPTTGYVYVSFTNGNTPDENQYLLVRSPDGGATWQGPFFVTPIYDLNFPRSNVSGRVDCAMRGQQNQRIVYTNSCFRSNAGGNVAVDPRSGAFADDLYLVMSDNRNGTVYSSNADIFLFKSTDGGSNWIGPTRVNDDRSQLTAGTSVDGNSGRDCLRPEGSIGYGGTSANAFAGPCRGDFGADQWWPWVDINNLGHLNIIFHDRRLDLDSVAHEWPTTRAAPIGRPGNYLVWTWGAQCNVTVANSQQCLAPGATLIPQPTAPINPGADPVPGQGASYLGTLHNFGIQDVPSNHDYAFRAGIFSGDYNNVAVAPNDKKAYGFWTDVRNGRSSGGPAGGAGPQPGRNPICEQADGMVDEYSSLGAHAGQDQPKPQDAMFLVTPCPAEATGKR